MCRGQFRSSWKAILTPRWRPGASGLGSRLNRGLPDAGPETCKLTRDVFVAPLQVLDPDQLGVAAGAESGDHQGGAGPDVGDAHDVAAKRRRPVDLDSPPVGKDLDPGPQGLELVDVLEAVVEQELL